jgi:hypothetical protein
MHARFLRNQSVTFFLISLHSACESLPFILKKAKETALKETQASAELSVETNGLLVRFKPNKPTMCAPASSAQT